MNFSNLSRQRAFFVGAAIILLLFPEKTSAMDATLKGKIVFSIQHELHVMNLDDVKTRKSPVKIPLPKKSDAAHHPAWMPGGEQIIFEYTQWPDDSGRITKSLAVVEIDNKKLVPYGRCLSPKNGNISYPAWAPNGHMLAYLEHSETKHIKDNSGKIEGKRDINKLNIYEKTSKKTKEIPGIQVGSSPFSWSADSAKIVCANSKGEISVCTMDGKITTFDLGRCPLWHPVTGEIYYLSLDGHLFKILPRTKKKTIADGGDWTWRVLIGISKDGNSLFFIGGGSFLGSEYSTIDVFDLSSNEAKTLSKRYSRIYGAALFEN
jgi:hypothetical protein